MDAPELYRRYRPRKFDDVLGNAAALKTLRGLFASERVPHALAFVGGSGCGKTTLARITARELGCGKADFCEVNCADDRGIGVFRDIAARMNLAPIDGTCRVWLLDEVHQSTGAAQSAALKMLEDTPKHVYFMLATTDWDKIKPAIRTRCTEIKVQPLDARTMEKLLTGVCEREGVELPESVTERIVEVAEGSARKALVLLHQVIQLDGEDAQLDAVAKSTSRQTAIEIGRALLDTRTRWVDMAKLLKDVDDEPETIRRGVLGYASAVLLSGKTNARAYEIIRAFIANYYDCGKAGLVESCYSLFNTNG